MLRKYTAILLLSLACSILLGHSVIPHHHLTDPAAASQKDADDDDSPGDDAGGLHNLFSHFIHSVDGLTGTASDTFGNGPAKQLCSVIAILPDEISIKDISTPHLFYCYFRAPAYIPLKPLPSGLRAPPAFVV